MAAIQLNFTLRTSSSCKAVHLVGSWDKYNGQLPLSKDPQKSGGWKGTFRFPQTALKMGQRYWYYYIIDGYHISHDPARESVVEPTTGRKLNVLDIPAAKSAAETHQSKRHSRRPNSVQIPKGRPVDRDKIESPRPHQPQSARRIYEERFSQPTVEALAAQFGRHRIEDDDDTDSDSASDSGSGSESGSDVPSLTSRSSNSSSPSSAVSSPSSLCTCDRYGITRAGGRVKLDCGGSRCGSPVKGEVSDSGCSSESDDDYHHRHATRRQGVVIRGSPR